MEEQDTELLVLREWCRRSRIRSCSYRGSVGIWRGGLSCAHARAPPDLQAPRAPHYVLYGHYSWFATPVEHFFMSSRTNGEAIIPDLLHDETLPPIGKHIGAAVACHLATLAAIALTYAALELRRAARAGAPPCRRLRETALKAYVIACWYFWLPCAIAFQCVLLVIDAVHLWGDLAFEDAMSAPCQARNNAFLMLPLLGENWHNNHHSTPHSASTWIWWYQVDCQYLVIRLFEMVGLASDVVVAPPSKLRDGYVAEGVLGHVLLEWFILGMLVSLPCWSGMLIERLGLRGGLLAPPSKLREYGADDGRLVAAKSKTVEAPLLSVVAGGGGGARK